MITLLTYDITEPRRLARIHRFMKEYGINTQKSVFECDIDDAAIETIRRYCTAELDLGKDSVRIYRICDRCMARVVISGLGIKITRLDYAVV